MSPQPKMRSSRDSICNYRACLLHRVNAATLTPSALVHNGVFRMLSPKC